MQDIFFPLDFVFVADGMVVNTFRLDPCNSACTPAKKYIVDSDYFLAVNAGVVNQLDLRPGQKVEINYPSKTN